MGTRDQAESSIRAGAWALAATASKNHAVDFLQQIAAEIRDSQWAGPNNR